MDSHGNAAFVLKAVKLLSDKNTGDTPALEVFSYEAVSDIFDESSGPSGSYILGKGGTLPFGGVFGLMTFQGVRKAAFNAFKMLNYLGSRRLAATGGTGSDGIDAMATMSNANDEIAIIVYDYYKTMNTSGADGVSLTVSNLPSAWAGKQVFITAFGVDADHSNPYGVWLAQGSPSSPTEAQWQALRSAQHLALLQPVCQTTATNAYFMNLTLPRQGAALILLGLKRPLTGRNALVAMEAEDYDGQSAVTKEASGDSDMGQSIAATASSYVYFENVDYTDNGVGQVQLRVKADSSTTVALHADASDGRLLGTCTIAATGGAWATQTCTLNQTAAGVSRLYLVIGGDMHLNWMQFQQ
jgi:hypothetical protein